MALKATIYKATVNVADLDRNQFLDASLTLAISAYRLRINSQYFSTSPPVSTLT